MSTCRVLAGLAVGGVIGGAASAACGAASGAIGAAVLNSSYGGYDVLLATQMVASGTALLGGATGAIAGAISGCSDSGNVRVEADHKKTGGGLLAFVGGMTIGGLIGYGLFLSTATSNLALNVGQVAASAAAGSAIFGGGLAVVTTVGILCCIGAAMEDKPEVAMEEGHAATAPRPAM